MLQIKYFFTMSQHYARYPVGAILYYVKALIVDDKHKQKRNKAWKDYCLVRHKTDGSAREMAGWASGTQGSEASWRRCFSAISKKVESI